MGNFYKHRYNAFIDNSNKIYDYISGNYLNKYQKRLFNITNTHCIQYGSMVFTKVTEYSKLDNNVDAYNKFKREIMKVLEGFHSSSKSVALFLISYNNELGVYLASTVSNGNDNGFDRSLSAFTHDVRTQQQFVASSVCSEISINNGIVTGVPNIDSCVIDGVISELNSGNSYVALMASPLSKSATDNYKNEISALKNQCESLNYVDRTFGNGTRTVVKESIKDIDKLKRLLDKIEKRLNDNSNQLWESCIWYGSSSSSLMKSLGDKIVGAYSSDSYSVQSARAFYVNASPFEGGRFKIPHFNIADSGYDLVNGYLNCSALSSYLTTGELSSLFQLPQHSYNGFYVMDNSDDGYDFAVNTIGNVHSGIRLGEVYQTRAPFNIPIDTLIGHTLVIGTTNSGKTNTVMQMVLGAVSNGRKVCIIEPAKKDYRSLVKTIPSLIVYSTGRDAYSFRINPLQPEEGTIISNHIDELMNCLCSTFDMEEPTKNAIYGLIEYTYERYGINTLDYATQREYPTMQDMFNLIDEYFSRYSFYGDEVNANVKGSTINRIRVLISGVMGEFMNCHTGLTGRDICSYNCVFELDDLSANQKQFVTGLLLVKLKSYITQMNHSSVLKNLIVVEEAHNVFSRVDNSVNSTMAMASNAFSVMLAEIREYGVGVVVSDQSATRISDAAIKNTGIKIVHTVFDEDDVKLLAYSLGLNEMQKLQIRSLNRGEAVVSVYDPRIRSCPVKVKVNYVYKDDVSNAACVLCRNRALCEMNSISQLIDNDARFIQGLTNTVYQYQNDAQVLKDVYDRIKSRYGLNSQNTLCAIGYALSKNPSISQRAASRIIYSIRGIINE